MVNIKFRKSTKNNVSVKNNVRNTNKTRQLKQEVFKLSSTGIHAGVQRLDRQQNKFCGN